MGRQLSNDAKFTKVEDHTSAGTSGVESASVDMAGYRGVTFLTSFGTAASDNTVNVQQSSDDGDSDDWSDVEGTSVSSGSSDEDVWVDVFIPTKRYVRLEAVRGTSSTLESIWAIQYGARHQPVDNTTSGTIIGEIHSSPEEGTA